MKPAQLPAAREVVMRRTDDVQVVIEPLSRRDPNQPALPGMVDQDGIQ